MRRFVKFVGLMLVLLAAYLCFWPVPVKPVAWNAPADAGYVGDFAANDRLAGLTFVDLGGDSGPEDVVQGTDGMLYAAVHSGKIVRIDPSSNTVTPFAETGGRPLGLEFGIDGNLYVADAYLGLLKVDRDGKVVGYVTTEMTREDFEMRLATILR